MVSYRLDTQAEYKKANVPFKIEKRPLKNADKSGWTSGMIFAAVAVLGLAFWFSNRGMSALATEEEEEREEPIVLAAQCGCEDCKCEDCKK